jgi:hypothetical protein
MLGSTNESQIDNIDAELGIDDILEGAQVFVIQHGRFIRS